MKAKVTGGTHGTATGIYEYEFTLKIALKLQEELENRGYEVVNATGCKKEKVWEIYPEGKAPRSRFAYT